jgi:hypothetical protein
MEISKKNQWLKEQEWPAIRGMNGRRRIYNFLDKVLKMCCYNVNND